MRFGFGRRRLRQCGQSVVRVAFCQSPETAVVVVRNVQRRFHNSRHNKIQLQGKHFRMERDPTHSRPMCGCQSCHRVGRLAGQAFRPTRANSNAALENDPLGTCLALIVRIVLYHGRGDHSRQYLVNVGPRASARDHRVGDWGHSYSLAITSRKNRNMEPK